MDQQYFEKRAIKVSGLPQDFTEQQLLTAFQAIGSIHFFIAQNCEAIIVFDDEGQQESAIFLDTNQDEALNCILHVQVVSDEADIQLIQSHYTNFKNCIKIINLEPNYDDVALKEKFSSVGDIIESVYGETEAYFKFNDEQSVENAKFLQLQNNAQFLTFKETSHFYFGKRVEHQAAVFAQSQIKKEINLLDGLDDVAQASQQYQQCYSQQEEQKFDSQQQRQPDFEQKQQQESSMFQVNKEHHQNLKQIIDALKNYSLSKFKEPLPNTDFFSKSMGTNFIVLLVGLWSLYLLFNFMFD